SCFVLPARFLWNASVPAEGWGFTVNEALSAGLPVITTDAVAAADDLIVDGVNGFKIKSDNPDDLAEKIKLLMENPEILLKMSGFAKDKMKNFTPQKQFETFAEALTDDDEEIKNIKKTTDEVHGWLSDGEAISLYKLAKSSPKKGVIVEIGSWQGKSTIWLAKSGSKIYAIDPHIGAPEQIEQYGHNIQTFEKFKSNINKAGVTEMVVPVVKDSEEAFKFWGGEPISFLFIDGSHQYEDVKKDFMLWSPLVMDGGIIAFHDSSAPGPSQVLEEFIYKSKNFRVIKVIDSLTVAYKGGRLPLFTYCNQRIKGLKKFLWRKSKFLLQGKI
ncbi:MAG: class I SAM-dependent methyltransferase, partial [Patescibacteria group bacterium]